MSSFWTSTSIGFIFGWLLGLFLVISFLSAPIISGSIMVVLGALLYLFTGITIKRHNDINHNVWWAMPLVNFFLFMGITVALVAFLITNLLSESMAMFLFGLSSILTN